MEKISYMYKFIVLEMALLLPISREIRHNTTETQNIKFKLHNIQQTNE